MGTLSFSNVDYVSRQLAAKPRPQFVIFDLRRVTVDDPRRRPAGGRGVSRAGGPRRHRDPVRASSGISREWSIIGEWTGDISNVRDFYLLDAAIEWAEDQVVYRYGGAIDFHETTELSEQALLAGLTPEELTDLASIATIRTYRPGEKIVTSGEPATSLFFLRSGAVHVTLPDGIRLATLTAGMAFGEMALLETPPLRRRAGRHAAATAYEIAAAGFRALPQTASAGQRADHAQPRATAGRPPDRRQYQGGSADGELDSIFC